MEKCALVTGSSSGLGLEISKFLIDSGYTVFGGSRSGTELEHENFYDVELDISRLAKNTADRAIAGLGRVVGTVKEIGAGAKSSFQAGYLSALDD